MPKPIYTPEYRAFHAYLDARIADHPQKKIQEYDAVGSVGGIGLAVGSWILLRPELGTFWTIVATIAGLSVASTLFQKWVRSRLAPKTPAQKWRAQLYTAIDQFNAVRGNRRLAKCLDPVVGQVLEAACGYWQQIHMVLNGGLWSNGVVSDTQSQIRTEAIEAADAAIDEIVVLCVNCIGEPKKTRGEEAKNLVSDLQDLRFGAALDRLGTIAASDDRAFTHQSPNLNAVFPMVRSLAERLHELSEEVERLSLAAVSPGDTIGVGSVGLNRIDSLIQNLQMRRIAEQELESEPQDPIQQRL